MNNFVRRKLLSFCDKLHQIFTPTKIGWVPPFVVLEEKSVLAVFRPFSEKLGSP